MPRRKNVGPCSIPGCSKDAISKGWCSVHYGRWVRNGDPEAYLRTRPICEIATCDRPHYGHGWCLKHYQRWKRHGNPQYVKVPETDEARFWSRVRKGTECWVWAAGTFDSGYGAFRVAGKQRRAHRFSYELLIGP